MARRTVSWPRDGTSKKIVSRSTLGSPRQNIRREFQEQKMSKKLCGLMLILAVGAGLAGEMVASRFLHPRIIEAQEFNLVDKNGLVLARLGSSPKGGWDLAFYNKDGTRRTALGVEPEGEPFLAIRDKKGRPRIMLKHKHKISSLNFLDEEGGVRIILILDPDPDKGPSLNFVSESGRFVWFAP